jgi:Polyketide cyclase / dehydrase and lipid transport
MRRHIYRTQTDLTPAQLYRAITDINRWPEWDAGLESTSLVGPCVTGARFTLKPKGGPQVKMIIEEALAPVRLTDVAFLLLARMRTIHAYEAMEGGTQMTLTIEVTGPLAFLWDRVVARPQLADAEAQTAKMIAFARGLT